MPLAQTGKAPRFSPDPIGFKLFFDSVKELAGRAAISDADAIKWAIRYAGSHGVGWDRVPSARNGNDGVFATFRDEVLKTYPGLGDEARFTLHDLDALVDRTHYAAHMTCESYGEYQRAFAACSGFLQDLGRLSAREASRSFLRGFPPQIHSAVVNRLAIRKSDVLPDNGYDIADVEEAALYVLRSRDLAYRGSSDFQRAEGSRREDRGDSAKFDELTKAVSSLTHILAANAQLQPVPTLPAPLPAPLPPAPAPGGADQFVPRWPQRQQGQPQQNGPPKVCLFCGNQGHFVAECPSAQEYVRDGKIRRNEDWKIVLPDGRFIPRYVPGITLKDKIDNFRAGQRIQNRNGEGREVISTNFLEGLDESIYTLNITPVIDHPPPSSSNNSWGSDPSSSTSSSSSTQQDSDYADQIQVMEAQLASLREAQVLAFGKKPEKFDGVHVPANPRNASQKDRIPGPPAPNVHAQKAFRPTTNQEHEKQHERQPQGPLKPVDFPAKPAQDEPKFHYKAPVEDSDKTREIVDRALDATITVSTRELLATSAEVRKQFKDIVGNKKVSANVAETEKVDAFLTSFEDQAFLHIDFERYDECAIAAHSLPLRIIHPTFAPGFSPECILDGGAQAVIIRKDVWERLRTPVATNRRMKMESANSGTTTTMGTVENYPVKLGDITILLQLQVIENAPFQVLLGRPFFDVTNCSEVSEQGGGHHLLVKDPKSGAPFKVATYPRLHKTPRVNFQG